MLRELKSFFNIQSEPSGSPKPVACQFTSNLPASNISKTTCRAAVRANHRHNENTHRAWKQVKLQNNRLHGRRTRKYEWVAFKNEARKDDLQLYHWRRVDELKNPEPYPFAKFNQVVDVPEFSDGMYNEYLQAEGWSLEETRYLLELCRRFDLRFRWIIVHDRYDRGCYGERSIEDLKERFYDVSARIALTKDSTCSPFHFDAESERLRKEQMNRLWNLTVDKRTTMPAREIENPDDIKKLELQNERLMEYFHDIDDTAVNKKIKHVSPTRKRKVKLLRRRYANLPSKLRSLNFDPVHIPTTSIQFASFVRPSAHMRMQEMLLPSKYSRIALSNIEAVLRELDLDIHPLCSEATVKVYNEFRPKVLHLAKLKWMLQNAESHLASLRRELISKSKEVVSLCTKVPLERNRPRDSFWQSAEPPLSTTIHTRSAFDIAPCVCISKLNKGGLSEELVNAGKGTASSTRRITSFVIAYCTSKQRKDRKRKRYSTHDPSYKYTRRCT